MVPASVFSPTCSLTGRSPGTRIDARRSSTGASLDRSRISRASMLRRRIALLEIGRPRVLLEVRQLLHQLGERQLLDTSHRDLPQKWLRSILAQPGAAVDGDARAGQILLFAQEAHDARDVGGRAGAAERDFGELLARRASSQSSGKMTVPGATQLTRVARRELEREAARQVQERRLRRRVRDPVGPRLPRGDVDDVDDRRDAGARGLRA